MKVNSILENKLIDINSPGAEIIFSQLEADKIGAFIEDAISINEAMDATLNDTLTDTKK